jgi:hypothetical protein
VLWGESRRAKQSTTLTLYPCPSPRYDAPSPNPRIRAASQPSHTMAPRAAESGGFSTTRTGSSESLPLIAHSNASARNAQQHRRSNSLGEDAASPAAGAGVQEVGGAVQADSSWTLGLKAPGFINPGILMKFGFLVSTLLSRRYLT